MTSDRKPSGSCEYQSSIYYICEATNHYQKAAAPGPTPEKAWESSRRQREVQHQKTTDKTQLFQRVNSTLIHIPSLFWRYALTRSVNNSRLRPTRLLNHILNLLRVHHARDLMNRCSRANRLIFTRHLRPKPRCRLASRKIGAMHARLKSDDIVV